MPVIIEGFTDESFIVSDPSRSSVSTGMVAYDMSGVNNGASATMRINLSYPHDDISINDEFPVQLSFI